MEDNKFSYTYSASRQKEIERIRKKYIWDEADEHDKLDELRTIDKRVSGKASSISLCVGILSALVMGFGMSLVMTDLGKALGLFMPFIMGILIGVLGMTGVMLAYPLYRLILQRERKKAAPEVIKLADELTKEG